MIVTANELNRWLARAGCTFEEGKKHTKVLRAGRFTFMPRHPKKEIKPGTVRSILKGARSQHVREFMVGYYALFEPDLKHGGLVVTFPDLNHGATQGETLEESIEMAEDLLRSIVSELMRCGEDLPRAAKHRGKNYRRISLPALQAAKAELYSTFRASGVRKAELARRIGIPKTNVERLFDLDHASRFDQIEAAFQAIGKKIEVRVSNAA